MTHPQPTHPGHQAPGPATDYFNPHRPGVSPDGDYVVLPRTVLQQLPTHVQKQLATALDHVHHVMRQASWPVYQVVPSRWARPHDMDETQLREVGLVTELNFDGERVTRPRDGGRALTDDDLAQPILISADNITARGEAL